MTRPMRVRRLRTGSSLAGAATLLAASIGPAMAQVASEDPPVQRPTVWVEPRVSAQVTLSSNGNLSSANPRDELTLEAGPGVRVLLNGPHATGFIDYDLMAMHHVRDTSGDRLRHALNAMTTFNAWDNRAFVDVSGVVADEALSAFGPMVDGNRTRSARFSLSPYLRGEWGGQVSYELRYSAQLARAGDASRSDIDANDVRLSLGSPGAPQVLGWTFDAASQRVDYSLGRDTRSDSLRAGLVYAVSPQLSLTLQAGVESNDLLTLTRESYSTRGVRLDWRPSPVTRLSVGWEDRYFGNAHDIALEHRSARTIWRFSDTRGVVNNPLDSASASLGSVYNLFDALYTQIEPDPIRRGQLVQAELLRLGLPADTQVFQSYLTSSATIERSQNLSLALVGLRGVFTVSVSRGHSRRLGNAIGLGDDFDTSSFVLQQGWNLLYAHRLTPLTSASAMLARQRSTGSLPGLDSRLTTLTLGLNTRLAPRTSGSVTLSRLVRDGALQPYGETAIAVGLNHRF